MIEIGNTIINFIEVGNTTPQAIDVGNTNVWPESPVTNYIVLTPSADTINETITSGTISVSANVEWNVYESLNWVTASKASSSVSWTASANDSSGRSGNIYVSGGGIERAFSLYQKGGYYINILTSPHTISQTGETIQIEVTTTFRDQYLSVSSAVTYSTGSGWIHFQSRTNNSSGAIFTFTCDQNSDSQNRQATFTFTQDARQGKSASISFTQQATYVPANISGFTRFFNDGDWQVGTFISGYQNIGGQEMPINAIAILNVNPVTAMCVANYTIEYYTRTTGSPVYNTIHGPVRISTTSTVSIPSGDTAYGVSVNGGPNLYITNVTDFSVTPL